MAFYLWANIPVQQNNHASIKWYSADVSRSGRGHVKPFPTHTRFLLFWYFEYHYSANAISVWCVLRYVSNYSQLTDIRNSHCWNQDGALNCQRHAQACFIHTPFERDAPTYTKQKPSGHLLRSAPGHVSGNFQINKVVKMMITTRVWSLCYPTSIPICSQRPNKMHF